MATKTLITLEEFDRLKSDGVKCELNEGELVEMTLPTPRHNRVVRRINNLLYEFLKANTVGELFFPDTPFILSAPDAPVTLRGPDLAFLIKERANQLDDTKRIQGAAELTIEVVPPSDAPSDLLLKTSQYLGAGGRVVWIVDPEKREVRVFEASGAIRVLHEHDTIEAPELLPGFSAAVARFFE
jgi:Uma2 family endonuclease